MIRPRPCTPRSIDALVSGEWVRRVGVLPVGVLASLPGVVGAAFGSGLGPASTQHCAVGPGMRPRTLSRHWVAQPPERDWGQNGLFHWRLKDFSYVGRKVAK